MWFASQTVARNHVGPEVAVNWCTSAGAASTVGQVTPSGDVARAKVRPPARVLPASTPSTPVTSAWMPPTLGTAARVTLGGVVSYTRASATAAAALTIPAPVNWFQPVPSVCVAERRSTSATCDGVSAGLA